MSATTGVGSDGAQVGVELSDDTLGLGVRVRVGSRAAMAGRAAAGDGERWGSGVRRGWGQPARRKSA